MQLASRKPGSEIKEMDCMSLVVSTSFLPVLFRTSCVCMVKKKNRFVGIFLCCCINSQ